MAVATGWTHGGLLQTAGIAPSAYGMDIYLAAEQRQMIVPLVDSKSVEPGEDIYIPKLGTESVTTLYAKTTTDGSTYSKSTDLQGQQISFAAIDDSAVQMMEKFQYVGMAHSKVAWDRMPQARKIAYLNGRRSQAQAALARAKDASLLSLANPSLVTSGNQINSGSPLNFRADDLGTILEAFQTNNGYGDIFGCLHTSQLATLVGIEKLTRYNWTGIPGSVRRDLVFTFGPLTIFTHNDVYSDGTDGYHGLFWMPQAIGFRDVIGMDVDDWYDGDTKSYKTSPDTDYAYATVDNTLVVTVQTPL